MTGPTPGHLTDLAEKLQAANSWARVTVSTDESGMPAVRVDEGFRGSSTERLDLSAIRPSEAADDPVLLLRFSRPVKVVNLHQNVTVEIVPTQGRPPGTSGARPSIWLLTLDASTKGSVRIRGAKSELVLETVAESTSVELRDSHVKVSDTSRPISVYLVDHEGEVCRLRGEFRSVFLRGALELAKGTRIEMLDIGAGDSTLSIEDSVSITALAGTASEPHLTSRLAFHSLDLKGRRVGKAPVPTVQIKVCEYLVLEGTAHLFVNGGNNLVFSGAQLELLLGPQSSDALAFVQDPLLELAGSHVVAAGLSGSVMLGNLSGGTILGDPDRGLLITGVRSTASGAEPLLGAQLENVRFRNGLPGLQSLTHAGPARRIEPDTTDLPGWDLRRKLRTRPPKDREQRLSLVHDADFMRRYAEIAREKGASGSASTKIGWCEQRLRHQVTTGWWEQLALWGYRLLGYGERPGPAFLTWLVASLLFTAILGAQHGVQLDGEGVGNFFNAWVSDAVSPIGSILRTGATTSDSAWVYLVRAVVAVPLIVGVLSLRKYTRSG